MRTSVAMCTYNGEKFLRKQIDSILQQTVSVDEIVICDDGSTDATVSILKSYESMHPALFKICENTTNLGSVKNFEKSISICSSEIIFLCDQDDIWVSDKVDRFIKYFEQKPDINVLVSNGFGIDDDDRLLDVISIWDIVSLIGKKNPDLDYFNVINFIGNVATGATMALRRKFIERVLPFPQVSGFHHDEWIALVASYYKSLGFIDDKTILYRQHEEQQVGGVFFRNTEKNRSDLLKFFSFDLDKETFANFKSILKRVAESSRKYKAIYDRTNVHRTFFEENIQLIERVFDHHKKEMMRKYPFRSFILGVSDRITNKRQIDRRS